MSTDHQILPKAALGAASRTVSWWSTHEFIEALVSKLNTTPPAAGTPEWCALADSDPLKLIALAQAGEHHVLRMETAQEARAGASRDVAASTDWSELASQRLQRTTCVVYIPVEGVAR